MQRLDALRQSTGRRVSLLAAVSEFAEASAKLQGRNLGEVVEGYLNTVASVKRKNVAEAIEEFIKADEPRTKAGEGQRAQLSSEYARIRALRLRRDERLQKILGDTTLGAAQKEALLSPFRQIKDDSARVFSGRPQWILASGDMFFGSLYVTDMKRGLLTLESELKRLAFLERSKIGQYDAENKVWRTYFPKNSSQTFDEFAPAILKLFGITKP